MAHVTANGIRLAYCDSGDPGAAPMVLLHGLRERAANWEPVLDRFAERHRVLAFDLRGHGDSDRPGEHSYQLMCDDVLAALDALDVSAVTLVGHSMGATVAFLIAMAAPERVDRLVAEDSVPPYRRSRPVWAGLSTMSTPTLLIGGGDDSHVPQDRLRDVAARIPDCTLVSIPAGHHVHETRPSEFARVVLDWLDRT